jgi:hypothetical protein
MTEGWNTGILGVIYSLLKDFFNHHSNIPLIPPPPLYGREVGRIKT